MDKLDKFWKAVQNLRPETRMSFGENPDTEEGFNEVKWQTGIDETDSAILTTTNPYPELTWTKVKDEMDKIQTEYDAQDYTRKRKAEYPSIEEGVHAILDDTLDELQIKRQAVKDKYPK